MTSNPNEPSDVAEPSAEAVQAPKPIPPEPAINAGQAPPKPAKRSKDSKRSKQASEKPPQGGVVTAPAPVSTGPSAGSSGLRMVQLFVVPGLLVLLIGLVAVGLLRTPELPPTAAPVEKTDLGPTNEAVAKLTTSVDRVETVLKGKTGEQPEETQKQLKEQKVLLEKIDGGLVSTRNSIGLDVPTGGLWKELEKLKGLNTASPAPANTAEAQWRSNALVHYLVSLVFELARFSTDLKTITTSSAAVNSNFELTRQAAEITSKKMVNTEQSVSELKAQVGILIDQAKLMADTTDVLVLFAHAEGSDAQPLVANGEKIVAEKPVVDKSIAEKAFATSAYRTQFKNHRLAVMVESSGALEGAPALSWPKPEGPLPVFVKPSLPESAQRSSDMGKFDLKAQFEVPKDPAKAAKRRCVVVTGPRNDPPKLDALAWVGIDVDVILISRIDLDAAEIYQKRTQEWLKFSASHKGVTVVLSVPADSKKWSDEDKNRIEHYLRRFTAPY